MRREDFLRRVRHALQREPGDSIERPPPPPPPQVEWEPKTLVDGFCAEVRAAGGHVWPVEGLDAARQALRRLVEEGGARTFVCSGDTLVNELRDALRGLEPADAARADVGVSGVRCAIAETGTLVLTADAGRKASLLPMTHIALVRQDQLVPGLTEALALYGDALPSTWVQASGPSRTADIELTLTTGVHGPGVVHVILVRP